MVYRSGGAVSRPTAEATSDEVAVLQRALQEAQNTCATIIKSTLGQLCVVGEDLEEDAPDGQHVRLFF